MRRVKEERDVSVTARLDGEQYAFLSAMAVRASEDRVKKELLNFEFYRTSIPYVTRVEEDKKYSKPDHPSVWLEGGIFGWGIQSRLNLSTVTHGIQYEIVEGSLCGLKGEVKLEAIESKRGKTVLLFFDGGLRAKKWPPAWIMERGAEIVFGFTAKRMRSFLENPENQKNDRLESKPGQKSDFPQARKRL